MEKGGLYKYYESLPTWAKGVLVVGVLSGVAIGSFIIYKKIKDYQDKKDSKKSANSAEDEYKKLVKQGQKLSFPEGKYISASNTIKDSLDGCETFIAEADVVSVVVDVVKKPIDWYFLVTTFGVKEIEGCAFGDDKSYALPELLKQQLGGLAPSSSGIGTSLSLLNKYLKKQIGITI